MRTGEVQSIQFFAGLPQRNILPLPAPALKNLSSASNQPVVDSFMRQQQQSSNPFLLFGQRDSEEAPENTQKDIENKALPEETSDNTESGKSKLSQLKQKSKYRSGRAGKRIKNGGKQVWEEELKNPRGFIEDGMWGGGYALIGLTPLMSVAWPLVPLAMGISFSVRSASSFIEGAHRDPEQNYENWRAEKNRKIKRMSLKSTLRGKKKGKLTKRLKRAKQETMENELKNPHRYLEDTFWAGFATASEAVGKGAVKGVFFWPAIPLAFVMSFAIRHSAEFVTDVFNNDLDTGDETTEGVDRVAIEEKPWETHDPDATTIEDVIKES